jgi:hypothetical protein
LGIGIDSKSPKSSRNLRRDIEVAEGWEDEIGEAFQSAEARSAVFDDVDDAVEAFAHGVCKTPLDEGEDVGTVLLERVDAGAETGNAPAVFQSVGDAGQRGGPGDFS